MGSTKKTKAKGVSRNFIVVTCAIAAAAVVAIAAAIKNSSLFAQVSNACTLIRQFYDSRFYACTISLIAR